MLEGHDSTTKISVLCCPCLAIRDTSIIEYRFSYHNIQKRYLSAKVKYTSIEAVETWLFCPLFVLGIETGIILRPHD
jgi:hypothetical protein